MKRTARELLFLAPVAAAALLFLAQVAAAPPDGTFAQAWRWVRLLLLPLLQVQRTLPAEESVARQRQKVEPQREAQKPEAQREKPQREKPQREKPQREKPQREAQMEPQREAQKPKRPLSPSLPAVRFVTGAKHRRAVFAPSRR